MNLKKLLVVGALALGATAAVATPASGITRGGVPDNGAHPYVGLMVAHDADGAPLWRCSGTLVSPTLYVTAGHCTEPPAASAEIFFDDDVDALPAGRYPSDGDASGTAYLYPDYDPAAFWVADLGAVVLDEPYELDEYASLADAGHVDTIGNGRKGAEVTAVGYGLQKTAAGVNPPQADRVRYQADLMIVNTQGAVGAGTATGLWSMTLSGDAKHGGTCFGDSGGPTFDRGTSTLLAVTSFGTNTQCGGVGGVFRIDHDDALNWLNSLES